MLSGPLIALAYVIVALIGAMSAACFVLALKGSF